MRLPEHQAGWATTHAPREATLEPLPQSAGRARTIVRDVLDEADLSALEDTATLLVSELVTNAVLHTGTAVDLRCGCTQRGPAVRGAAPRPAGRARAETVVQHGDSVLRDLALASIAASPDRSTPTWQASHIDLGPVLDAVREVEGSHVNTVDVIISFPVGAGGAALARLAEIDQAEHTARDGALVSTPSLPQVSVCRRWLLTEIGRQEDGGEPIGWTW